MDYKKAIEKYGGNLVESIQKGLGYYVLPEYLYQTWIMDINSGDFEVQKVTDSLHNFERSVAIESGKDDFKGLFSSSFLIIETQSSICFSTSDNVVELFIFT